LEEQAQSEIASGESETKAEEAGKDQLPVAEKAPDTQEKLPEEQEVESAASPPPKEDKEESEEPKLAQVEDTVSAILAISEPKPELEHKPELESIPDAPLPSATSPTATSPEQEAAPALEEPQVIPTTQAIASLDHIIPSDSEPTTEPSEPTADSSVAEEQPQEKEAAPHEEEASAAAEEGNVLIPAPDQ